MSYCFNCSYNLPNSHIYCGKCGTKCEGIKCFSCFLITNDRKKCIRCGKDPTKKIPTFSDLKEIVISTVEINHENKFLTFLQKETPIFSKGLCHSNVSTTDFCRGALLYYSADYFKIAKENENFSLDCIMISNVIIGSKSNDFLIHFLNEIKVKLEQKFNLPE